METRRPEAWQAPPSTAAAHAYVHASVRAEQVARREYIVELFAGGAGAGTGIRFALNRAPDMAVNHDDKALAMYRVNHPETRPFHSDVFEVDPLTVTRGRRVGMLWASPDCTFHSKARGAKPIRHKNKKRRALAWVVTRWAGQVRPRVIFLENVEEFADWGPLKAARCRSTGRVVRMDGRVALPGEVVPIDDQKLVPCGRAAGRTFNAWVASLEAFGYRVEWRELRARDYGHPDISVLPAAPTIRRRLFLIARCDGRPIVWPAPTHGAPDSPAVEAGRLQPYRTAGHDCIDFTIPMLSIFATKEEAKAWGKLHGRPAPKRPLAPATMRRNARGVKRYVLDNPKPFIVGVGGRMGQSQARPVDQPFQVAPVLAHLTHHGEQRAHALDGQVPTVTGAQRGELGLIAPILVQTGYGEREGQAPRSLDIDAPLGTVVGSVKHAVTAAFLTECANASADRCMPVDEPLRTQCANVKGGHFGVAAVHMASYHSEQHAGEARGGRADEPVDTLDCSNRHAVVASFLAQHNGGFYDTSGGAGRALDGQVGTVCAEGSPQALVAASLVKLRGTGTDADPAQPLDTISGGGTHHGVVAAHLLTNTTGHAGAPLDAPVPTLSTGGQQALVASHLADGFAHTRAHEVYAFLMAYFGTDQDTPLSAPIHTVTTRDRYGLVTVDVDGWRRVMTDICMRMLQPPELYIAQGFPSRRINGRPVLDYVIDYGIDRFGRRVKFTKTEQVRMCGNSVCPPMAAALVLANVPELRRSEPRGVAALVGRGIDPSDMDAMAAGLSGATT